MHFRVLTQHGKRPKATFDPIWLLNSIAHALWLSLFKRSLSLFLDGSLQVPPLVRPSVGTAFFEIASCLFRKDTKESISRPTCPIGHLFVYLTVHLSAQALEDASLTAGSRFLHHYLYCLSVRHLFGFCMTIPYLFPFS